MSLKGHLRTLGPRVRQVLSNAPEPPGAPWGATVEDPVSGTLELSGIFHPGSAEPERPGGSPEAVLLVHGLGGSAESPYMAEAARTVARTGLASLRLSLRGADRRGADYYHSGLTADVAAALASPELEPFERLYVLGFSLGGHVALVRATEETDSRVRGVAAVCAPIDLVATGVTLDRRSVWPYRRYLLRSLSATYAGVAAAGGPTPIPVEEARAIRTFEEWDDRVVAARFDFEDHLDYRRRASVGPRLGSLRVPSLLVAAEDDPLVPADTVRPALDRVDAPRLEVHWARGAGHLGFPESLEDEFDLGLDRAGQALAAGPRVEDRIVAWLRSRP